MSRSSRTVLGPVAALLPAVMALAAFAGPAPSGVPASEVQAREVAFAKTMADRDLEAFTAFISPEAIFFSGDTPLRGRDAVVAAWTRYFQEKTAPFSWHPDLVEVLDSGDLALTSGPVLSETGEPIGRFNSIWRRESDGQWRVVFDRGCK